MRGQAQDAIRDWSRIMLRNLFFAATLAASLNATLATAPAVAGTWRNYDGYRPIPPIVYALPYGFPAVAYTEAVVGVPVVAYAPMVTYVPVVTYAPVRVRVYDITQRPPYYNVPPYAVYAPY